MEGVRPLATAGDDAEDRSAARRRRGEALERQGAAALGHDEAVAIARERPTRFLGRRVLGRQGGQQREANEGLGIDRAVRADAHGSGLRARDEDAVPGVLELENAGDSCDLRSLAEVVNCLIKLDFGSALSQCCDAHRAHP